MNTARDRLEKALSLPYPVLYVNPAADAAVKSIVLELLAEKTADFRGAQNLKNSKTWIVAQQQPPEFLADIAFAAGIQLFERHFTVTIRGPDDQVKDDVPRRITAQLFRRRLPFTERHLTPTLHLIARSYSVEHDFPTRTLITACERFCAGNTASGELRRVLQLVMARLDYDAQQYYLTQSLQRLRDRIKCLLDPSMREDAAVIPPGPWGENVKAWLTGQSDAKQAAWSALFIHAATAGDKSRPTKTWLKTAQPLVSKVTRPVFASQLRDWLDDLKPDPDVNDPSLDVLKGLIWAAQSLDPEDIATAIGRFATVCFRKVPNVGARSVKLGNACIVALEGMSDNGLAVAELVRLKTAVKYPSVRKLLDGALDRVASATGVTVADLEESTLPTFGLDAAGTAEVMLGDAVATITLDDDGTTLAWRTADGKPRKAPPVAVKRDHAEALKQLKARVKDIEAARATQIKRLEASWLEDRSWPLALWRERFVDHPLRHSLASGLIWSVVAGDKTAAAMLDDTVLRAIDGKPASTSDDVVIRLWHPLDADPAAVTAWRHHIISRDIVQPIKQAHREIYVLTDAERATETYSNRFAAHILRQHQFRALCQARGWAYDFMGGWDSWNVPTREVPHHLLAVEYHVEAVENDERSEAYIPLHLASDQVRFVTSRGDRLALEHVPPIVFSELMRDVDLFVAVSSVANDPDWTDGGPEGRFGDYWREYAFGELTQTAATRRELLSDIVPKLSIADRARLTERYLEVDGTRHSYRIHLGSANIQIMPENRYLCIVRGRMPKGAGEVRLPFSGDTTLSIILSKAFMLANDDKITDKTILTQL